MGRIRKLLFEVPEEIKLYHVIIDIVRGFFIPMGSYNNHYRGYKKTNPRTIEIKEIEEEEEDYEG